MTFLSEAVAKLVGKAEESRSLGVSALDKHLYSFGQARAIALQES